MRKPFPYESNGILLSQILVPYPIGQQDWEELYQGWKQSGAWVSLLAWITQHHAERYQVLRYLEVATGAEWKPYREIEATDQPPAEWTLLAKHEFHIIGRKGPHWLVAGGPDLPPNLERYIGPASKNYQWVLVDPLEHWQAGKTCEEAAAGFSSGSSEMEQIVRELLETAVVEGASDVFVEAFADTVQMRLRKASGIQTLGKWKAGKGQEIPRLLKRWANLSTASSPLPQDGRIGPGSGLSTSFRISHLSAENGESLVLRVAASTHRISPLSDLGVDDELSWRMRDALLHDRGLVLCTGSTCSGKTTTACSLMNEIAGEDLKIMSIEDPVEHELPGIVQSSINRKAGWDFTTALKAYLRQDPDIIMIGEIRDGETARMACRAALTGHGVLATMHARSPGDVLQRLLGWGLERGLIDDSLRLIVHQRLKKGDTPESLKASFTGMRHPQKPVPA